MTKIEQLKAAYEAATPQRLEVVVGESACFHCGNQIAVVAIDDSNPDEVLTPTVAEFWPASDGTDLADATLYVLMHNAFPIMLEAVEALEETLKAFDHCNAVYVPQLKLSASVREHAEAVLAKLKG